jgi:hypothetical protein
MGRLKILDTKNHKYYLLLFTLFIRLVDMVPRVCVSMLMSIKQDENICYESPNICTILSPLYYLFTSAYMLQHENVAKYFLISNEFIYLLEVCSKSLTVCSIISQHPIFRCCLIQFYASRYLLQPILSLILYICTVID